MNLTELRAFLDEHGIAPRKSMSQNFLIDSNIVRKTVELGGIKAGDRVLEIGPGPGALTKELLDCGADVVAVELDRTLAPALNRFQNGHLTVHEADILEFPLDDERGIVMGNLPYAITSPILGRLVPLHQQFSHLVVMIQEEVARRLLEPGSLSYFVQLHADITYGFKVSNQCYYPKPKVDSAVVRLDLKKPMTDDPEGVMQIVRLAFQQRRKMLRASLRGKVVGVVAALEKMGKPPTTRPEEMSIDDFIEFFQNL